MKRSPRKPRGPVAGVRVIDASRVLAGPYLAMLLGDLGADVIKIEKPDGGDQTRAWGPPWVGEGERRVSAYYVSANRNKRSVALDLKSPEGRHTFEKLLATADILVENFLPREWRRLGFRSTAFPTRHPPPVPPPRGGHPGRNLPPSRVAAPRLPQHGLPQAPPSARPLHGERLWKRQPGRGPPGLRRGTPGRPPPAAA